MTKRFFRFMAAFCIMTLMFTTCAFAEESSTVEVITDLTAYVQYYAQSYVQTYGSASKAELEYMIDNSVGVAKELAEGIYKYAGDDELGSLLSIGEITVENNNGVYKAVVPATYEKGNMTVSFEMQYLLEDLRVTDVGVEYKSYAEQENEQNASLGSTMKQAGINTLIGISIVFLVLAFMSILIAQFKHINRLEQYFKRRREQKAGSEDEVDAARQGIDNGVAQIVENEASLMDDLELAAVITAAIAAYEDEPSDGFVVRQIRRVRF